MSARQGTRSRGVRPLPNKKANVRNLRVGPVESADSLNVRLRYPIRGTLATVGTAIAKRWQPNAAYDVDPVLGSTSTPGFAEYAAIYTYYRVHEFTVDVTFSNLDNLSTSLYSVCSNTDPGTAGTNYFDYAQGAFGRTYELAPFYSGAGSVHHRQTVKVHQLLGMSVAQADSFRATTTGNPTDLVFWGFGIYSNAGTNFANGVGYSGFIEMNVRFYSRQDQLLSLMKSGAEWEAERRIWKIEHPLVEPEDKRQDEEAFEQKVQWYMKQKLKDKQVNADIFEAAKPKAGASGRPTLPKC